jgi:hypothetical protein
MRLVSCLLCDVCMSLMREQLHVSPVTILDGMSHPNEHQVSCIDVLPAASPHLNKNDVLHSRSRTITYVVENIYSPTLNM